MRCCTSIAEQYLRAFETFNREAEQPCADPAAPPTVLGFEYCQDRFDGVLESSGADESVGLMPPRHVRIAVEYAAVLPAPLRRVLIAAMQRLPVARHYTPILDFEHPAELMMRWNGFTRQEIEALCDEPVSFEHTQFLRTFGEFPRTAHFERYSALEDAMPNDRVHQAARMTGLPVRFPYYEAGVDAYIRALPVEYRYQPGEPKRILRELLARHVPRSIWDAPKHGFDFPLLAFLEDEDYALVREYLDEARWRRWRLLDPTRVAAYGERFIAGEQPALVPGLGARRTRRMARRARCRRMVRLVPTGRSKASPAFHVNLLTPSSSGSQQRVPSGRSRRPGICSSGPNSLFGSTRTGVRSMQCLVGDPSA